MKQRNYGVSLMVWEMNRRGGGWGESPGTRTWRRRGRSTKGPRRSAGGPGGERRRKDPVNVFEGPLPRFLPHPLLVWVASVFAVGACTWAAGCVPPVRRGVRLFCSNFTLPNPDRFFEGCGLRPDPNRPWDNDGMGSG